jgi:phage-related protein
VSIGDVRLQVVFYRSDSGAEPVRRRLKSLPVSHKKAIGEDVKTVQFGWPMGMPLVETLSPYLWEVRTKVPDGIARVMFTVDNKANGVRQIERKERVPTLHAFIVPSLSRTHTTVLRIPRRTRRQADG